jgi:pimeloyl-ACP methyl ester carboxylesterase
MTSEPTPLLPFSPAVPFTINTPASDIQELKDRVHNARWPETDVGNEDWSYGVPMTWLKDLTAYWADEFDWPAWEAKINELPQFMATVDGVHIHFVHVKSKNPGAKPIILSHGWPWTFWDWQKVIGPLTDPVAYGGNIEDSFDVVIPSTPGMGFSVPLEKTGVDAKYIGKLWHTLMKGVLGYDRWAGGGGDWGSTITGWMAHQFPEDVIGVWLTLLNLPGVAIWDVTDADFAPDEEWMKLRAIEARPTIQSHSAVHRKEPQTIAYGLVDSPIGTAAWLWGRRKDWGDHGGDVLDLFDRDFLCIQASIYWFNRSIATSTRIYHDHYINGTLPEPVREGKRTITVPTAVAVFPKELLLMPRAVVERTTNLQRWEVMPKGGHYPPSEQPELTVHEIREFFRDLS